MLRYLLVFFSIFCTNLIVVAQPTLSEGYIKYNVTVDSDIPATALLSFGTTLEVAFKGQQIKAMARTVGGANTIQAIANYKNLTGLSLINVMGKKKAVKFGKNDYYNAKATIKKLSENPIRFTETTKSIAGYTCQKVLMKDKQTGASIVLYVTNKINPKEDHLAQELLKITKGFPLEITVHQDNTTVNLTAQTVSLQTLNSAAFSQTIPSGYQLTTLKNIETIAQ